ncbi:hypothetical protein GCM10025868_24490 [Angustibacter aerolatus]|uniref:Uncharacterized protein n=1 Tax=Angustibacter aerolatus TaxID=1162965 RepID=A0ABQ6JJA2_9ACTN|nr:hypothetical protein GCM10025868_24490 [Angustibacter aerolatus]
MLAPAESYDEDADPGQQRDRQHQERQHDAAPDEPARAAAGAGAVPLRRRRRVRVGASWADARAPGRPGAAQPFGTRTLRAAVYAVAPTALFARTRTW